MYGDALVFMYGTALWKMWCCVFCACTSLLHLEARKLAEELWPHLIGDECLFHWEPAGWMAHYFGLTDLFWSRVSFFIPLVVIFHFSPLSALPASSPCFQWSHLIAIWSVLFCHYHHVLSVCSHIFQELINWRFLQSCWNIFFYTVAADAGIHF